MLLPTKVRLILETWQYLFIFLLKNLACKGLILMPLVQDCSISNTSEIETHVPQSRTKQSIYYRFATITEHLHPGHAVWLPRLPEHSRRWQSPLWNQTQTTMNRYLFISHIPEHDRTLPGNQRGVGSYHAAWSLTHWRWDEIDAFLQTIFANEFPWMKMY